MQAASAMRRSSPRVWRRPVAVPCLSSQPLRFARSSTGIRSCSLLSSSTSTLHGQSRSAPFSSVLVSVVCRQQPHRVSACPAVSVSSRPPSRLLSTQLPTGGAPASPSASSSTPFLGAVPTASHPSSLPHSPHPNSTAPPAAFNGVPASASSSSSSSPSSSPSSSTDVVSADVSPANESRLRRLFRQYGVVAVGSYLVIYVSTLGMLYVAVKERWLGGYDIQHLVDALGLAHYYEHIDPRKGDFAVAWVATKFTEPLRLALTAAITPAVARMVGRAPPKEGKGVRAKVEARIAIGVEQAKDKVEEKLKDQSTKH